MLLKILLSCSTIGLALGAGATNASLLTSQNNNPQISEFKFNGHFPGLGPYGEEGNQDHAWGNDSAGVDIHIKFDLSTTSEQYINNHYLAGKGDTPWYGIYDFETDAYSSAKHPGFTYGFSYLFYEIKVYGDINKMMKDLSDWIGYTDSHHNRLRLQAAYFEVTLTYTWYGSIHWHWNWGYNRPF